MSDDTKCHHFEVLFTYVPRVDGFLQAVSISSMPENAPICNSPLPRSGSPLESVETTPGVGPHACWGAERLPEEKLLSTSSSGEPTPLVSWRELSVRENISPERFPSCASAHKRRIADNHDMVLVTYYIPLKNVPMLIWGGCGHR